MIAAEKRDVRAEVEKVWKRLHIVPNPERPGPVLLGPFLESYDLLHVALPNLSRGVVYDHLRRQAIVPADIGDVDEDLAGFLFITPAVGFVFVNASDTVARQRFTAAHELGHFVMHRDEMKGRVSIADKTTDLDPSTKDLEHHEREANRFAAELLMPEAACRARAEELKARTGGACPRLVLAYRLASELLVSREAMRYRLEQLEVGDED